MNISIALGSAAAGYLLGSISNGRLIARRVAPGKSIEKIEYPVPGSDIVFASRSVSATAVREHIGIRYGCLTAVLDMLKVLLPTLVFRLLFPVQPYHLIAAGFGLVGHDWPLFFRFRGGRGESPIIGGLLVIDPFGLLITSIGSVILGLVIGHILVFRWAWLLLLIPWFALKLGSWPHVAYLVFVNIIYRATMGQDLLQYARIGSKGVNPTQEEIAEFFAMGKPLGRVMDRFSLLALFSRLKQRPKQVWDPAATGPRC